MKTYDEVLTALGRCEGSGGNCDDQLCPYWSDVDDMKCHETAMHDAREIMMDQNRQIEDLHNGIVELIRMLSEEAKRHGRTMGHEGANKGQR